ncbi:hypothetical protein H9P43_009465 [Blastocladiella emersonii ATCC 22665]|nr:hypothetical protein H9P43_009465 [Blastocladiella emersonii ATCC 22665]
MVTIDGKRWTFWRSQFPIELSYAITAHKAQGMTLNKVIADFGDPKLPHRFPARYPYMVLSRARRTEDILIIRFNKANATRGKPLPKTKGPGKGVRRPKKPAQASGGGRKVTMDGFGDNWQLAIQAGLSQFARGPELQPEVLGFVNRCLKRYADDAEWDRVFAPLAHVNHSIWANLMELATWDEFDAVLASAVATGDNVAKSIYFNPCEKGKMGNLNFINLCIITGAVPLIRRGSFTVETDEGGVEAQNLLTLTIHHLLILLMRSRLRATLRKHKVLRGLDALAAARAASTVTDAVLHVVARHSQSPAAGNWAHFNHQVVLQSTTSHGQLARAMHRVKLPPEFIDLYFKTMVPELLLKVIKPGHGVVPPLGVGEEEWSIFYDAALCEIHSLAGEVVAARGQV